MQPRSSDQEALNAPLFASLVERLHAAERRCVVLDLGAARTETLALFGQFRSRMEIADLADGIEELNGLEDPELLGRRVDALLPGSQQEPADVVLCWDLLNYLDRAAFAAVMSSVAERVRPGALAHALIVYSSPTMPQVPATYVPLDEQRLISLGGGKGDRKAPRWSPEDLSRLMPGFAVERARLLRNGMQEFLFRA